MKSVTLPVLIAVVLALLAVCPSAEGAVYCRASFDDKLVDQPIGTGGPGVGEPVFVSSGVSAMVRGGIMPSPCLQISDQSTTTAGSARFELLGGAEITSGFVVIEADFWFESYEDYFLYVREQGTAAHTFTNLYFNADGEVRCSDSNGPVGVIGTYETGRHFPVKINYNMDTGVYFVILDDVLVLANQSHGVTGRGIGSVLFGCTFDTDLAGSFCIDHLFIGDYLPPATYLEANFNYKALDAPIGLGGAEYGEPFHVNATVSAMVRDDAHFSPSLEIRDQDDYAAGAAEFHFLKDAEVTSGLLIIAAELWVSELDLYTFAVREHGSSAHIFSDLAFLAGGTVVCSDESGSTGWFAYYEPERVYPIVFIHNLDAGTYSLWFDGELAIENRAHGVVGRGIGKVSVGCLNDPDLDGAIYVDNLYVGQSSTPNRRVCCVDNACGVVIPMDCAFHEGEYHPEWLSCVPNPCAPSDTPLPSGTAAAHLRVIPNPFFDHTTLSYTLDSPSVATIAVYDPSGRRLWSIICGDGIYATGEVVWDGRLSNGERAPAGVYFARLVAGDVAIAERMLILE